MMRDIYESAKQVIVWLGEEHEDSYYAICLIQMWATTAFQSDQQLSGFDSKHPTAFKAQSWSVLEKFFQRPWWKRVWVYQEFVVAQTAVFVCGSDRFHWKTLVRALSTWLNLQSFTPKPRLEREQLVVLLKQNFDVPIPFLQYRLTRQLAKDDAKSLDLFYLIKFNVELDSTDPRDKIYALLGVDEVKDVVALPDYGKPVSDVYTEFVVNYIKTRRDTSILCYGGIGLKGDEEALGLPSWVPDFRSSARRGQHMDGLGFTAGTLTGSIHCVTFSSRYDILNCKGVVADTITELRPNEPWPKRSWHDLALSQATRKHPTGIPQYQAFFRTMVTDHSGIGYGIPNFKDETSRLQFFNEAAGFMKMSGILMLQPPFDDVEYGAEVERWNEFHDQCSDYAKGFQIWRGGKLDFASTLTDETLLKPFLTSSNPNSSLDWPQQYDNSNADLHPNYVKIHAKASRERSFFVTAKGYMGLGPYGGQVGDKVCILLGSHLPLVIRSAGDHYLVVGGCYVYGMMNGEMVDEIKAERLKVETLHFK